VGGKKNRREMKKSDKVETGGSTSTLTVEAAWERAGPTQSFAKGKRLKSQKKQNQERKREISRTNPRKLVQTPGSLPS